MSRAAVDDIICRLLLQDTRRSHQADKQVQLGEGENEIRSLFMRQPNLVDLDEWMCSCGSPRSPILFRALRLHPALRRRALT